MSLDPTTTPRSYDEKASHASFLEALSEWRTGRAVSAVSDLTVAQNQSDDDSHGRHGDSAAVVDGADAQPTVPRSSLLEGEYDEDASAVSFRAAVDAWRCGSAGAASSRGAVSPPSASEPVQTDSRATVPIEIKFESVRKVRQDGSLFTAVAYPRFNEFDILWVWVCVSVWVWVCGCVSCSSYLFTFSHFSI